MPNENENQNLVDETVEKIVTMNNLQDAFDRYNTAVESALSDAGVKVLELTQAYVTYPGIPAESWGIPNMSKIYQDELLPTGTPAVLLTPNKYTADPNAGYTPSGSWYDTWIFNGSDLTPGCVLDGKTIKKDSNKIVINTVEKQTIVELMSNGGIVFTDPNDQDSEWAQIQGKGQRSIVIAPSDVWLSKQFLNRTMSNVYAANGIKKVIVGSGADQHTQLQINWDMFSTVATTGDYDDLLNKPEHNPDDINNNIFRKGIGQWSLEIKTGSSAENSSSNTTTWTIRLTQDMIDVINELANGNQSYLGGPLKYCSVRCLQDPYHLNIESVIRITRESTSIPDLQVGDEIVFTITGQWIDFENFWTGVENLYIGDAVNAKIVRSGSDVSGWTVGGYYFSWDKISAKKVTADTVGDKDGTLAELRESVSKTVVGEGLRGMSFDISANDNRSLSFILPNGNTESLYCNSSGIGTWNNASQTGHFLGFSGGLSGVEFSRYSQGESIDRCVIVFSGMMSIEFQFSTGKILIYDHRSGSPVFIREI